MDPISKALWFIESHLTQELTLEEIARVADVSRFHLARVFAIATGMPVMRYVRARRLTESACALAGGAPDILALSLDSGYGSHEAFTRAFRDHFGITPDALRSRGFLDGLNLKEPIRMDESLFAELEAPRLESYRSLLIAGLGERYQAETCARIPLQWEKFGPHLGHIPGQVGPVAYGVLCNGDEAGNTDYITGVEVSDFSRIPADWSRLRIPQQQYAIFAHRDHVSAIRRTWFTIWNRWFPSSGYRPSGGPELERYGPEFNPVTGLGGVEIWIPVRRAQDPE